MYAYKVKLEKLIYQNSAKKEPQNTTSPHQKKYALLLSIDGSNKSSRFELRVHASALCKVTHTHNKLTVQHSAFLLAETVLKASGLFNRAI